MMTSPQSSGGGPAKGNPSLGRVPSGKMPLDQMPLEMDPLGLDAKFPAAQGMVLDTMPLDTMALEPQITPAVVNPNDDELPEPLGFSERLARKEREAARRRKEEAEGPVHLTELEERAKPKSVQASLGECQPLKRLPLSKVGQGDDSPSFYLSLSDLMSLLLVFFVLIFSMSELSLGTRNDVPKKTQTAAPAQVEKPLNKPMAKASAKPVMLPPIKSAKSKGGPMDLPRVGGLPGMTRKNGPVNLGLVVATFDAPGTPKTGKVKPKKSQLKPKAVRGLAVDKNLLAMVTMSQPAPQKGLPERPKKPAPKNQSKLGNLKQSLQPTLAQGMEITTATDRLIISLPESITFSLGEAEIITSMHKRLALLAVKLNHHTGYNVVITGHTDDIPISNQRFASNWELSAARAAAVGRSLLAQGVDRRRITIKGMADTRPKLPNNNEHNRMKNRRVEIELHPV